MLANALLSFWRNLLRHRLYTALNVAGLALGVGVFLILAMVTRYEFSFDRWMPGVDQLYRVDLTYKLPGLPEREWGVVSFKAYEDLRAAYPQITDGVRVMSNQVTVRAGDNLMSQDVEYTDPEFFRLFRYPLVAGDAANALARPDGMVITQAIARKWFGTDMALGRHVTVNSNGQVSDQVISGVMRDFPGATSFKPEVLMTITGALKQLPAFKSWDSSSGSFYFRATPEQAVLLTRDFPNELRRLHPFSSQGVASDRAAVLSLMPWQDVHFRDLDVLYGRDGSDRRVVMSLGVVGVLALLAAAINYINLATARSLLRAREVAMRKVMGATRARLVAQYLIEAVILVAFSGVIGLALAELGLPVVASLGGWLVKFDYEFGILAVLVITLVVGLGAGAYPAFALASFKPGAVLGASKIAGGGRASARLRSILVGVQFAFAVVFAISALVVQAQVAFMRHQDRGFVADGMMMVPSLSDESLKSRQVDILDALRQVPGVSDVTLQNYAPGGDGDNNTQNYRREGGGVQDINMASRLIGTHFFQTYKGRFIAGRDFDLAHARDDESQGNDELNVVLDEEATVRLGFASPQAAIGKRVLRGHHVYDVIGVVADVRYGSARERSDPQVFIMSTKPFADAQAAIRFRGSPVEMRATLERAWRQLAPGVAVNATVVNETLAQYYRPDQQRGELFAAGAIIAIFIACLGLYGLASFNATRRLHEIGIRKTLGATTRQVLVLVIGQFLAPVLVAGLIACPVAFLAMRSWLSGFDQRIALSPLYFVGVLLAAILLCAATVFGQTYRLARAEPARALRAQ